MKRGTGVRAYILVIPLIIIVSLSVFIGVQGIAHAQTTTIRPLQPDTQVVPIQISTNTPLKLIKQLNNIGAEAIAVDSQGNIYLASGSLYNLVEEVYTNGTMRTLGSGFGSPESITIDSRGNVYVVDDGNNNYLVEIYPNGTMRTIENLTMESSAICGVAFDSNGNRYGLGANGKVVEIYTNGTVRTMATGLYLLNFAAGSQGNVYGIDLNNDSVMEIYNNGTVRTLATGFYAPQDVAVDSQGNVYVADTFDNWVVEIDTNGSMATLGSGFRYPMQVAVDSQGDLYVLGNGTISEFAPVSPIPSQYSGDNSSSMILATPLPTPSQAVSITATLIPTPTLTPMQTATSTEAPSGQGFSAWWIVAILVVIVVVATVAYFFMKK